MHPLWLAIFAVLALIGQVSCWLAIGNRLEAAGWKRSIEKPVVRTLHVLMLALTLAIGYQVFAAWRQTTGGQPIELNWIPRAYLFGFSAVALGPVLVWVVARLCSRPPAMLCSNHTVVHDLRHEQSPTPVGGLPSRLALALPGNQCLQVSVHEKTLRLPRLDPALSGLSIAHLSDLHMSGRISRAWFERAMEFVNDMDADLVALTGDLVETAACFDWIPHTLGRLRARHGVYFVLGNHDLRVDPDRLRAQIVAAGLIDMGGKTARLKIRGQSILLAGNERPWFQPLPAGEALAVDQERSELRVLLAHTPDQIGWARRHQFDLMLAGHTHGGQVRLPGLGPLVSPSLHGGKYAGGVFDKPPTVLHVSRGLSGLHLLRWNCPPELTRLVLVRE